MKTLLKIKRCTSPFSVPITFMVIIMGGCGFIYPFIIGVIFVITMVSLNNKDDQF